MTERERRPNKLFQEINRFIGLDPLAVANPADLIRKKQQSPLDNHYARMQFVYLLGAHPALQELHSLQELVSEIAGGEISLKEKARVFVFGQMGAVYAEMMTPNIMNILRDTLDPQQRAEFLSTSAHWLSATAIEKTIKRKRYSVPVASNLKMLGSARTPDVETLPYGGVAQLLMLDEPSITNYSHIASEAIAHTTEYFEEASVLLSQNPDHPAHDTVAQQLEQLQSLGFGRIVGIVQNHRPESNDEKTYRERVTDIFGAHRHFGARIEEA